MSFNWPQKSFNVRVGYHGAGSKLSNTLGALDHLKAYYQQGILFSRMCGRCTCMPWIVLRALQIPTHWLLGTLLKVSTAIPFPDGKTKAHTGSSESMFVTILLNHFSSSQLTFVLRDSTLMPLGPQMEASALDTRSDGRLLKSVILKTAFLDHTWLRYFSLTPFG